MNMFLEGLFVSNNWSFIQLRSFNLMLMATSTGLAMLIYQYSTYLNSNSHPAIIPGVLYRYPLSFLESLDIQLSYPIYVFYPLSKWSTQDSQIRNAWGRKTLV